MTDTDIWGHMRFGLDLLESRALPMVDRYSFTSNQRWINHEWLSDLLFAFAYSHGGLPGLTLLRVMSLGIALLAFERMLRRVSLPLRDFLIAATVLGALPVLTTVRPQSFSVPLYGLTLLALSTDAVWLPIVFAVWANLHGGWLIGLGAVAARAVLTPSPKRSWLLVASTAVTLLNPYGFSLWSSLTDAMSRGWSDVTEWQPIWIFSLGISHTVVWSLVTGVLVWAAGARLNVSRWEWAWTIIVGLAAARARRHVPFFAITAALLVLSHVRVRAASRPARRLTAAASAILAVPLVAAGIAAFSILRPTLSCMPPMSLRIRPDASAVQYIKTTKLHGRVLMWFDWGEFALWHVGDQLRVSLDNRRETVYSQQIVDDHGDFYGGRNPGFADRIGADYIWLPPSLPAVAQMEAIGWHKVFRGPRSVILSRQADLPFTIGGVDTGACFPSP